MKEMKEFMAGNKRRRKLFLVALSSLLLVASIIGIAVGVTSRNKNSSSSKSNNTGGLSEAAHIIVKSSCSSTLYPELCYSAISESGEAAGDKPILTQKDVIEKSLNLTTTAVEHNYFAVEKIIKVNTHLSKREKTALHDCLETIDETLDELRKAKDDLDRYPNKKSLKQHADDLKTLMSAAMTNQETCLDGFSHDEADKKVRQALLNGEMHVYRMCSNALAMIKNMTDTDIVAQQQQQQRLSSKNAHNAGRKLLLNEEGESDDTWPSWLSAGDRKLLQSSTVTPNVVVAADGSGDHKTVTEAVAAAPEKSSKRYVIKIKAGVYKEKVEVSKKKTNIMFVGDGRTSTIITGSLSVKGGSTTFHSATVAVVGDGFLARDITFQNTAGHANHQAVALRVGADLSAFYQCDILAYQDSLYVHSNRQFFSNCLIAGTVDFIFGNAAAMFQDSDIHARKPGPGQKNMVTAQGRTDPNQNTGIVIQKCRIAATSDLQAVKGSFPTYLGRPWKEYSRTVIMQSTISDVIDPVGWHEWNGNFALDTLFYREYLNTGPGASTSKRVTWKGHKVITSASEAQPFTAGNFIGGSGWLGSTGFPYSLTL